MLLGVTGSAGGHDWSMLTGTLKNSSQDSDKHPLVQAPSQKRLLHFQKHINYGKDECTVSGWHLICFEIHEPDRREHRRLGGRNTVSSRLQLWIQSCQSYLLAYSSHYFGESRCPESKVSRSIWRPVLSLGIHRPDTCIRTLRGCYAGRRSSVNWAVCTASCSLQKPTIPVCTWF